jgi:hypothetical protein
MTARPSDGPQGVGLIRPVSRPNPNERFADFTPEQRLDYLDFHPRLPKSGKNVVYMDNHVAPLDVAPSSLTRVPLGG